MSDRWPHTYRCDVFDRHIAKDVDTDGDGTRDRGEWYAYDGDHVLIRSDRSGTITNRYLHGPEIDMVFADESTADGLLWALADQQGTVRDWADYASGTNTTTIANHVKCDSFGNITGQSSGTYTPLFVFTGREWDADAELYYYRLRWYDPAVGEFIGEDPSGFAAGDANLDRYVGNGPTNAVDPSGLQERRLIPDGYPSDPFAEVRSANEKQRRLQAEMQRALETIKNYGSLIQPPVVSPDDFISRSAAFSNTLTTHVDSNGNAKITLHLQKEEYKALLAVSAKDKATAMAAFPGDTDTKAIVGVQDGDPVAGLAGRIGTVTQAGLVTPKQIQYLVFKDVGGGYINTGVTTRWESGLETTLWSGVSIRY